MTTKLTLREIDFLIAKTLFREEMRQAWMSDVRPYPSSSYLNEMDLDFMERTTPRFTRQLDHAFRAMETIAKRNTGWWEISRRPQPGWVMANCTGDPKDNCYGITTVAICLAVVKALGFDVETEDGGAGEAWKERGS